LGIGDWGLGIGDWGLGPIPNPHFNNFFIKFNLNLKFLNILIIYKILIKNKNNKLK
jgi:hypothetical protein